MVTFSANPMYVWKSAKKSNFRKLKASNRLRKVSSDILLKEGALDNFDADAWHTLSFHIDGTEKDHPQLTCAIDGKELFSGARSVKH